MIKEIQKRKIYKMYINKTIQTKITNRFVLEPFNNLSANPSNDLSMSLPPLLTFSHSFPVYFLYASLL